MEHLHWPSQVTRERPKTPRLCDGFQEDICGEIEKFASWPTHQNWVLDSTSAPLTAAHQCQSWLFFGCIKILTHLNGEKFDIGDYIQKPEYRFLNSAPVNDLLKRVKGKLFVKTGSPFSRTRHVMLSQAGERLYCMIGQALREYSGWIVNIVHKWECNQPSYNPWDAQLFNVFWSSLMLLELICDFGKRTVSPQFQERIQSAHSAIPFLPNESKSYCEGLKLLGRCQTLLQRLKLSPLDGFRLMALSPRSWIQHHECNERNCELNSICTSTYAMKHDRRCRDRVFCPLIQIDTSRLDALVDDDAVPVVCSQMEGNGVLSINLVDSKEVDGFTAISHVWAGGLGNFSNNSHFECQLRQIHEDLTPRSYMKLRSSKVYYWFDTLCIPTNNIRLKVKAINSMASIYANASSVFVIDPELSKLRLSDVRQQDVSLALLSSPWMSRSWTLQEGALAIDLRIRLADTIVPLDIFNPWKVSQNASIIQSLWEKDVDRLQPPGSVGMFSIWNQLFQNHFQHSSTSETSCERFMQIWNQLCDRNSSKSDDVAVIFATFMGYSAGEVLHLSPTERMHALLKGEMTLPISVLFAPQTNTCLNWCPAFPNSIGERYSLCGRLGYMNVQPSGLFEISNTSGLSLLQLQNELTTDGTTQSAQILLREDAYLCVTLQSCDYPVKAEAKYYILLPSTGGDSRDKFFGRGLYLVQSKENDDALELETVSAFSWKIYHGHDCSKDDLIPPSVSVLNTHLVSVSDDKPDLLNHKTVTIDIGAKTWPQLTWSRPDFFPFAEACIRAAQPLNFFLFLPTITHIILWLYFGVLIFNVEGKNKIAYILAVTVLTFGRQRLAAVEYLYLHRKVHRMLQRKWASSFNTNEVDTKMAKRPDELFRNKFRQLTHCYVFILAISAALLIVVLRQDREQWCTIPPTGEKERCGPVSFMAAPLYHGLYEIPENPILVVPEGFLFAFCVEFLLRIFVLYASRLYIGEISPAKKQDIQETSAFDRTYVWTFYVMQIFFIPFLIFVALLLGDGLFPRTSGCYENTLMDYIGAFMSVFVSAALILGILVGLYWNKIAARYQARQRYVFLIIVFGATAVLTLFWDYCREPRIFCSGSYLPYPLVDDFG